MRHLILGSAALVMSLTLGSAAIAQDEVSDADMAEADQAAMDMMQEMYVYEPLEYRSPTEVITRLRELGYTNFRDFDVEWGSYEVEATSPDGDEVEIEINSITGSIADIDENWF